MNPSKDLNKSKKVPDSESLLRNIKFRPSGGVAGGVLVPDTTGWDVQTSSEVTPDGRAFRTKTVAKTDGIEKIDGGQAEFTGRNEKTSSASQEGDEKNSVKKASESSKTHLQEKIVTGDENSKRTEMKTSSVTSSSSKVVSSSVNSSDDTLFDMDKMRLTHGLDHQKVQSEVKSSLLDNEQQQSQGKKRINRKDTGHPDHTKNVIKGTDSSIVTGTEKKSSSVTSSSTSSKVVSSSSQVLSTSDDTEFDMEQLLSTPGLGHQYEKIQSDVSEENRKYEKMDKSSPEYQQHVQYLMSQPGTVVSTHVEYPKPGVKMITTTKKLPDGTTVKTKHYETNNSSDTGSISSTTDNFSTNQGDERNLVKKGTESSTTSDENVQRTEKKTSSVTSSSSSKVVSSSSQVLSTSDDTGFDMEQIRSTPGQGQKILSDVNSQRNVTNVRDENSKYESMDKSSPEYQQHVQYLMSQEGTIVSTNVEYPKPGVKMITTVKKLPDGTTVKTKHYETNTSADTGSSTNESTNPGSKPVYDDFSRVPTNRRQPSVDRDDNVSVASDNSITYEKRMDAAHQAFARSLR